MIAPLPALVGERGESIMKTLTKAAWPILLLASALVWASCTTIYTGAVTLTKVVESAAHEYAKMYNDGLVPPDLAVKASLAHQDYRKAAGLAADALTAYKLGNTTDTAATLEAARLAATNFIEVLVPIFTKQRTAELKLQIQKASAL